MARSDKEAAKQAPKQPIAASDQALRAHRSRVLALLDSDSAEERAEAFQLLRTAAKAPRGLLLLEEEYEVSAASVMVPCVHPLLEMISRPFMPLPPSVSGTVSLLVDDKTGKAIAEFKQAAHADVQEKSLAAIADRLQSAPERHDDARFKWKPKKAMRHDEWRALAVAIVNVLPCRRCLDPALNTGSQCRTDCYECARLVRKQKVEFQQQRAQSHADECGEASKVLQLITAAGESIDSSTLADSFGAWASPVGALRSGLDCPPAQVKAIKAATKPKTVQGPEAAAPASKTEAKQTGTGGKAKKKPGAKGKGARKGKNAGGGKKMSTKSPGRDTISKS